MKHTNWYKDAVIYQIYPRSFKDSNGDGFGDIPGIISKLDYLKELGVNCVWLSPVYNSPQADNGYDISDYCSIYPPFGTMDDFDLMLKEMHKRGIRLIMDLVVNHTSSEHPWFIESRKSKDNPYRDFYIWKKGKGKNPPNNWTSFFGGKAWEYDELTDEWYLRIFTKEQPDLNWENPKVREEVKKILKFWLDKGVDGFRCDVINLLSKDQSFKSGHELLVKGSSYFVNGPRIHEFLNDLNLSVLDNYDCMTVGETCFTTLEDARMYAGKDRHELNMIFNFDHTSVDNYLGVKWLMRKFKLINLKKAFDKWQYGNKEGWNSLFIENHDQRRSVGRFNTSSTTYRKESSKMLATMCYLQKGTPFIYQGQEIGMTNGDFASLDEIQDTETHTINETMKKMHLPKSFIKKSLYNGTRDNARTPMQWDDSKYAGFSTKTPWLKVNENKSFINVKESLIDENSILNYFKKLIEYRKNEPLIKDGVYLDLDPKNKNVYIYSRKKDNEEIVCISNFSDRTIKYKLKKNQNYKDYQIKLSNYQNNEIDSSFITLKPYEVVVLKNK